MMNIFKFLCLLILPCIVIAKDYRSIAFSHFTIEELTGLNLYPSSTFTKASYKEKTKYVTEAFKTLRENKNPGELITIIDMDRGELWAWNNGQVQQLDAWSDSHLSFNPRLPKDQIFGFLGGQLSFGDNSSKGITGRIGTTLFKNKYDLAFSFSTFKYKPNEFLDKYSTKTFALIGRRLFVINPTMGWNAGTQIIYQDPVLKDKFAIGLLAGLNFFLGGGNLDTSFNINSNKDFGLLVGYTFYLKTL